MKRSERNDRPRSKTAERLEKPCSGKEHKPRGEILPLERFQRHHGRPDGRQMYCRECAAEYSRKYRADKIARQAVVERIEAGYKGR